MKVQKFEKGESTAMNLQDLEKYRNEKGYIDFDKFKEGFNWKSIRLCLKISTSALLL